MEHLAPAPRRRRRGCRGRRARRPSPAATPPRPSRRRFRGRVPSTSTPISRRSAFATAPAATCTAVCLALARSSASRVSSWPYLSTPARSACPGRGSVTGLVPFPVALALRRPRAHPPRPVLVIAVADDERKRRPQRPAVPQAREHLDPILLELLSRAAAVALLTSAEIVVDRVAVEHEAGGQAAHDRDERWPVRLAGRSKLERHTGKPTAARIASMGAGTPVQSSNEAAPCATRTSNPPITVAPARRAAAAVAVSGYGRSTSVWPGPSSTSTSSRADVAFTTSSASSTSGGQSVRLRVAPRLRQARARTPWPLRRRR